MKPERTALSIEYGRPVRVQSPASVADGGGRRPSVPGSGQGIAIAMRFTAEWTMRACAASGAKSAISRFVAATISPSLMPSARWL
jgi:hypothetical protein